MNIKNKRKRIYKNRIPYGRGGIMEQIQNSNKQVYKPLTEKEFKEFIDLLSNEHK